MLISHKHKFIFIKTMKTAGTSIEIALSKFCGDQDIITPIVPVDEQKRQQLGYRGPQNYLVPFRNYSTADWLHLVRKRQRVMFKNHVSAAFIINHIDKQVWNSYYKFCFERNPWDKVISWYYWEHKHAPRPTISEFVQSQAANKLLSFDLYAKDGEPIVDKVYKLEELDQAMADIAARVGLPELPELPRTKADIRKDRRCYHEVLSPADREKIARLFAREIAYFDYEW